MGIRHFFPWFKQHFSKNIYSMKKDQDFTDIKVDIDTLMIDMNGVFHNSAQKVYQYGNYKPQQKPRFLGKNKVQPPPRGSKAQLMMFEDVCRSVDDIFKLVKPNKTLVLCVDGPAPLAKQCIAAGTKITLSNGTSCPIENIKKGEKVFGWNGHGFTSTSNLGLQVKGNKETIKLTFIDGRNLICTLDHRILVMIDKEPIWKQAGDLKQGDLVIAGLDSPLDIVGDDEKDWVLNFAGSCLSMNEDREKLLILSRILGYIHVSPKTFGCELILDTRIDAELCAQDICILTGERPEITKTNNEKRIVTLSTKWSNLLSELPDFLLKEDCPLSLIREFVAALFGSHGHAPKLNVNKDGNNTFTPVNLSQSITEKYMEQICSLLDKLGVPGATIKPNDIEENSHVKYLIELPMNTDFGDKVGYRYAHNKSLCLTIASSYWRLCNEIINLDAVEFLDMTNTASWFKLHSYPYEQEDQNLPMYTCPIIDIRSNGKIPVYDIEVVKNHSFLANGLCVHNCQQRQRRFRSSLEQNEDSSFNSNCITPGTKFMDFLTKYIDWYIKKRISEDEEWKKIKVIFSNEKAPGEGESKCFSYVRNFGFDEDKYCIYGLDADLIMLALATHKPNFYILRDDLYDVGNEFFCLNIGSTRKELSDLLRWNERKHSFDEINAINDFIFICFMVGNDFLPHIPSIEIIEGGIDLMIEIYKEVGLSYGHLTQLVDNCVKLRTKQLAVFLGTIGQHEKENFETKLAKKESFFPDPLLENCSKQLSNGKWSVDIDKYKKEYFNTLFPPETIEEKICHEYIEGLQWVLSYYTHGVSNWKWYFSYHYAPPASVIAKHAHTFIFSVYSRTISSTPYQQLLCVLPPKSANLIPKPLCYLLTNENSPLKKFCPDNFEVDLSGKRREWEGIVILPIVDFNLVRECYMNIIEKISDQDMKRNKLGRSFIYEHSPQFPIMFQSYYGNIEKCCVRIIPIDL